MICRRCGLVRSTDGRRTTVLAAGIQRSLVGHRRDGVRGDPP
ncbi:MAG: hypothetical protein BIP78_0119 [Candidatus Bipolaricaulis sibiricus]|uniref:Uncharacterized protein n=1 Tax=Bipolaricaulis sibiricus TaxID=2501609 RepID=A0A410FS75_BIPS1|nr:MAG: hypothetical protein BIP78_0119 [Candidatus Bipolaricaulis sibiricus]